MENYGLLFTVFISINISANKLPSSWQSKLRIVLSFALVTAWSSMCCSEGELTRTHRKPSDTRYIEGSGGAVWLNAQPKVFPSEHAGAILQITENNR